MTRMIRVSSQEIYDMAWSPNGETLVVGGTDFVARIVNPHDGTVLRELSDHTHYVQGVAWDPLNEFLATQSSDRSVHVHTLQNKSTAATGSSAQASTSSSSSGYVPPVTRNSRMDLHRRTGSGAWSADFAATKPSLRRGSSHASQIESDTDGEAMGVEGPSSAKKRREGSFTAVRGRSARSHTPMEPPTTLPHSTHSTALPPPSTARGATPTPASSVPQSPAISCASASASAHPMNPPQKTPSRRSSFSGSQAEVATSPPTSIASFAQGTLGGAGSAASIYKAAVQATGGNVDQQPAPATIASQVSAALPPSASRRSASRPRSLRSPSPAPLPAIRPPPSPRQRLQAAQLVGAGGHMHGSGGAGSLLQAGMRMYGDESFSGFFRRLSFSPDGALLVTPSGIFEAPSPASPIAPSPSPSKSPSVPPAGLSHHPHGPRSTVYLYGRASLTRSNAPIAHLPGHKTATLVVRFSPILYELRKTHASAFAKSEDGGGIAPHPNIPLEAGKQKSVNLSIAADEHEPTSVTSPSKEPRLSPSKAHPVPPVSMIGLPYRMVFAVATHDVVWIYDTQQGGPLCCFSNMHYASFTDLTWSPDGQTLIMSSSDGYCSVAVFDHGELGTPYSYNHQPSLSSAALANLPPAGVHPTSAPGNVVTLSAKKKTPKAPSSSSGGTKETPPTTPSLGAQLGGEGGAGAGGAASALGIATHLPPSSSPTPAAAAAVASSPLPAAATAKRATLTTVAPSAHSSAGPAATAVPTSNGGAGAGAGGGDETPKTKKRRIQPTLHESLQGARSAPAAEQQQQQQ